jgi:hypothetical protein
MTAVEARNKTLWNGLPIYLKKRIEDSIKYAYLYHEVYKIELYKSITPEAFVDMDETILKLKGLGYGVEYIDGSTRTDGTDSKLVITW